MHARGVYHAMNVSRLRVRAWKAIYKLWWFLHEFYSDIKVYTIPQFRLLLTGKVSRLKIRQHRNPPKFSSGALKNFQLYGTSGGSLHVFSRGPTLQKIVYEISKSFDFIENHSDFW